MSTGMISNWAGNPLEIGAMYPFVGGEGVFFLIALIFWIVWMIWQMQSEGSIYKKEVAKLKEGNLPSRVASPQ